MKQYLRGLSFRPLLAGALIGALLAGCAANPTGGTNVVFMSEKRELEIGQEEHEKIMQTAPIYNDPELQAYVEEIGNKLAKVSDRPDLDYTFTIIDSPEINAFALPGGYIYVNRGLLTFLTNEAQLAAVLGHEIAHVTARHAVQRDAAQKTSSILGTAVSVVSVFATGTNVLGDTASLFGGALVSGYGREMELEADQLGAEYMYNAGYDPSAVIDVIGVLKNQEDFMKKVAGRAPAYHGLFATHPRNDARLQQAVGNVGTLNGAERAEIDPAVFRQKTTGLVVGPSAQNLAGTGQGRNRYYQNLLNYTIVFPDKWTWDETTTTVTAKAPEGTDAALEVGVQRLQTNKDPRAYFREDMGIADPRESEPLSQFGLQGWTGIDPATGNRRAVVYYNGRAYLFTGRAPSAEMDDALLASIRSFRPIARNEGVFANPLQVTWVQVNERATYDQLARLTRIPEYPADTLRLMNGDYPGGEPEAGEWIKITN